MFDWEENPKTGLRQWHHILQLELYIIDVRVISYDILGACIWKKILKKEVEELWFIEGRLMPFLWNRKAKLETNY